MQVGVDVKCMHTNFGEGGFSGYGDIATLKNIPVSHTVQWENTTDIHSWWVS